MGHQIDAFNYCNAHITLWYNRQSSMLHNEVVLWVNGMFHKVVSLGGSNTVLFVQGAYWIKTHLFSSVCGILKEIFQIKIPSYTSKYKNGRHKPQLKH